MRKFILAALFVSSLIACNPGTPTGTGSPPDPSTPPPVIDPIPSEPDPSAPDTTAPTITLSQPESNDAAINSSILVNFSEPMKSETVSVTLEPSVNLGTGEWKSEEAIEFVPTTDFAPETTYKVNVTGKDVAGNVLAGSSTYQFKTSKLKDTTAPSTPQGLNAVSEEEQVKLSWKANTEFDLKGYTIQYGTDANNLNLKTFIAKPGSSKTITGLTGGTTYYFALIAEDRSGNKSKRSGTVNAKPKTSPATKLVSSSPANGAVEVSTGLGVISFTFSKAIKHDSFKVKCIGSYDGIEKCHADLAVLLGIGSWNDNDKTVKFKPTSNLQPGARYGLLPEGKDTNNRPLEKSEIWFTTATAPTVLRYVPPANAKGIPDGAYIYVVFSKKMNMESLKAAFTGSVNSRDGTKTRPLQISRVEEAPSSQGGFAYNFVPSEKYGDGTIVTWLIQTSAMDVGGSRLLAIVADGFRVLQRLMLTIPVNPNWTGAAERVCVGIIVFCRNDLLTDSILVGYDGLGTDGPITDTAVFRGAFGFSFVGLFLPENLQFVKATLNLKHRRTDGTPFSAKKLDVMSLERVDYGTKLDRDDFNAKPLSCFNNQPCVGRFYGPPDPIDGPIDVLSYIQADWAERSTRGYQSHFRLRFVNNKPVTGSERDRQVVEYVRTPTLTIEYLAP
jgi:Bacterial Ig-like domain/Fibronectin type III domain